MSISTLVKSKAAELGFAKCGITPSEPLPDVARARFLKWLEENFHGKMAYMARTPEKRVDPGLVLDGASSLISVLMNYYSPQQTGSEGAVGRISRYAWGRDYHDVFIDRLRDLAGFIFSLDPNHSSLCYVDTGPVLDKWWAEHAGLGWTGKNANLITTDVGSWVFVGEILTTLPLPPGEYDRPFQHPKQAHLQPHTTKKIFCGSCVRCLEACPTRAIVAPFMVDARRCISYLTIELRESIPREMRPLIGNRIFGCDDCQEVCPWNRFAVATSEPGFAPAEGHLNPHLISLLGLSREEFRQRFKDSPIRRAKYSGFLRNVAVALGNSHSSAAVPALISALHHDEPLVRQHAAWALGEIAAPPALSALETWRAMETNPSVLEEIDFSLNLHRNKDGRKEHLGP